MRVGIGYDVHRLVPSRKLILGGVELPYAKGLLGHSDADVLTHAIIDALLGAASKGDIGRIFPDANDHYKDISSLILLERVNDMLIVEGYRIVNIDAVIIAQAPKISPYIDNIIDTLCERLTISKDQINIKATTEEGLGFTGAGEGIAAKAVCLIDKN